MNRKQKILLAFCFLTWAVLILGWAYTYDTTTPAGGDDPAEADDRMREIKLALQERLNVEHKFDITGTEVSHADTGKHTDITTLSIVNAGALSNAGDVTLDAKLDVAGNIDPTTFETTNGGFLDEDNMVSDAADKVASQQSIKAQIAIQVATALADYVSLSAYTNLDSENNPMLKTHAYKAQTDGFVYAYSIVGVAAQVILAYVGTTDNPPVVGDLIQTIHRSSLNNDICVSIAVAKGEYFEILSDAADVIIRWKSHGALLKPIDFN